MQNYYYLFLKLLYIILHLIGMHNNDDEVNEDLFCTWGSIIIDNLWRWPSQRFCFLNATKFVGYFEGKHTKFRKFMSTYNDLQDVNLSLINDEHGQGTG